MPDSTVNIIYITNATEAAAKTNRLTQSTARLNNTTKSMAGSMFLAGTAMMVAHKAMSYMTTTVKDSVKQFREFELRIAEVGTILDEVGMEQIPRMTESVEDMSITYARSTSDMAKGLYDILSAAFSATEAIGLLDVATKASVAGLSDVRTSVDIFTSVLNAYGKSASQAAYISDILFQSVVRGKFQFEDLESSLGYVAPIASMAGVKFEELMAALSTATRHGLHLDMTARGLALAMQNIINPTESAAKAARDYGIDMTDIGLRVKGLAGWFADLNEATKKFGKGIVSELIPNMRSMRVAMVLASDQGVKGFADDLALVYEAGGRTEEAFNKIADTSKFAADKIAEASNRIKRAIGDDLDEAMLELQKFEVAFLNLIRGIGEKTGEVSAGGTQSPPWWYTVFPPAGAIDILLGGMAKGADKQKEIMQQVEKQVKSSTAGMTEYERAIFHLQETQKAEAVSAKIQDYSGSISGLEELNNQLDIHIANVKDTTDAYNNITAPIDKATDEMMRLEDTLTMIGRDIERLNKELNKSVSYGWGEYAGAVKGTLNYELQLLKAEKSHADLIHDVNSGLQSSTYVWKTNNAELKDAVDTQREYNDTLEENNLAIAKLQLTGMRRRRGLTRGEERRIKMLRIENMEQKINADTSKSIIDKRIFDATELTYQMKYTYDQQILDLEETILAEGKLLNDRKEQWNKTLDDMLIQASIKMMALSRIMMSPVGIMQFGMAGFNTMKIVSETMKWMKGYSDMPKYQSGTYRVPKTGLAIVDEGETITPKGSRNRGGIGSKIHVDPMHINVNIYDHTGVEQLVQKIELAIQGGLIAGITTGFS